MKRPLLLLLVCMMWAGASYAQDLIVTTAGDSIFCKILRERDGLVYFDYIKEGKPSNAYLASDSIVVQRKGLYKTPIKYAGEETSVRWQYRLQGGYSRRIARISDQVAPGVQEYLKKMRSGYTFGGDIHYFISQPFGLGIKYNHNGYQYTDDDFKDKIRMNYIAVSALNRATLRSGDEFSLGGNIGYQSYRDQLSSLGTELTINGSTVGIGFEVGYGVKLAKASKLLFNLSLITATITKINVETGGQKETIKLDKEQFEGLGRLELTVGLLFGK